MIDFDYYFAAFSNDHKEEAEIVRAELTSLGDPVVQARNPLWADRDKARVFGILRVRIGRVSSLVKSCGGVLRNIREAMFPLNSKL